MRDVLSDVDRWLMEEKQVALATVVQTWGSAPRRVGARLAVAADGQFSGSVSGGCVENAVIAASIESLKTGRAQLMHFGVPDETAWEVGLACGGSLDVFVKPVEMSSFAFLRAAWTETGCSVHVTVIRGSEHILGREILLKENGEVIGTIGNHRQKKALELAHEVLLLGESQRRVLDEETELLLEFISPPPTLIAVGGVHIALALTSLAKTLGYQTAVIEPRGIWGNAERFPHVDQLISLWPDQALRQTGITPSTAIVILTHDPKLDDEALKIVLKSPAFYIGALGSKKTNANRRERLLSEGITDLQFSRLHAPVGLDIHAQTPEEIALSIMAEVVKSYRRREQVPAVREPDIHPMSN